MDTEIGSVEPEKEKKKRGRPPGKPNALTKEMRERIIEASDRQKHDPAEDLMRIAKSLPMHDKRRAEINEFLMGFMYPKKGVANSDGDSLKKMVLVIE